MVAVIGPTGTVFGHRLLFCATLVLLCCLGNVSGNARLNAATKEVLDILRNADEYDNGIMASNGTNPLDTQLQLYFREVDIDDIKMQINIDVTFRMLWNDPRLKFNAAGVEYVTITEPELAWFPDPFFKHAISTQQLTIMPQNYLRVYRDGGLVYSTRLILLLSCPMDFTRFPHDKQLCSIPIASYGYTTKDLVFRFADNYPINHHGAAMHSTNFKVDGFLTQTCDTRTSTGVYSCVKVVLNLDRLVNSYILEWYIPTIFLVIIAAMSEVVVVSEFLTRVLLTLIPLITMCIYGSMYALLTTSSVPYIRPLDIFSGISMLVVFFILLRVMILHYYAQRKLKEERGELLPRQPRDDFLEKIVVNADVIAKSSIAAFYLLFILTYFLAYST